MASHNTYNDPYAHRAGDYGGRENEDFSTPSYAHQSDYNTYNNYNNGGSETSTRVGVAAEKPHPDDIDGVNTLGEIGGTARARPGRAGLHQPTSSFAAMGPPPRSTGILRMWRKDERGKQWFRGGGVKGTLRLACCCLTVTFLIVVSIVLTTLMYVRPPSITLNGVSFEQGSVQLDPVQKSFHVAVNLSISVANPNWFAANFDKIRADVKYEGGKFGGGTINKVNLDAYKISTFDFPFYLNYSATDDANGAMIKALANSCGVGSVASNHQIQVNYNLKLWLRILSATIAPSIDDTASLDCPLSADNIKSLMG